MGKAKTGDEVIVGAGTYALAEGVSASPGVYDLDVHGDETAPMPKLVFAKGPTSIGVGGPENRVAYLGISMTGSGVAGLYCPGKSLVERVRVDVVGDGDVGAIGNDGCVFRDSVFHTVGKLTNAMYAPSFILGGTTTVIARNVTAIAEGVESVGLYTSFMTISNPGSMTVNAKNLIAQGGKADIETSALGGTAQVLISNSNYRTVNSAGGGSVVDLGANQTALPAFVNAADGDYREAAGSPTIDAGSTDQIGTTDLEGNPRTVGTAPDIGAYEYVPPPGQIQSLAISPKAFRALNAGEAIFSAKKKPKAPVGTNVTFALSGNAAVYFFVERKLSGRRVKGKCVKRTKANRAKKRCPLFKPVKGTFADSGRGGLNSFKFSGRIGGRGLRPGRYRLVGSTSAASTSAPFRVVR